MSTATAGGRLGGMWVEPEGFTQKRLRSLLTAPNAVIRHDVDYDLDCAVKMGWLEHELAVQSTYYLLPWSPHYDAHDEKVLQLVEAGHRLGVHVDLAQPRDARLTVDYLAAACRTDYLAMAYRFGSLITRRVSFHAPPRDALWRDVPGFESAHAPEWQDRYVSDSRGRFNIPPEERLSRGDTVQVNLHPEWHFWPKEKADEWRRIEAAKP